VNTVTAALGKKLRNFKNAFNPKIFLDRICRNNRIYMNDKRDYAMNFRNKWLLPSFLHSTLSLCIL